VRQDAYEAVFGALAHPARRRILLAVYFEGGSMTAGAIARLFGHAWPTTTRHLKVLEAAGLLEHERRGRTRCYRINCRRLRLVGDWLAWFSRSPAETKGGSHGRKEKCESGPRSAARRRSRG
jgi:DNA-binding transcriptional ArsR family regulator